MRYIHELYTPLLGRPWDNQALLAQYEPIIEEMEIDGEQRAKLRDFVRFQLVGERSRRSILEDWRSLTGFEARASAFERGAEEGLDLLAAEILPAAEAAGVVFDAVIATTATGNLMPGLSYRAAHRLGSRVRPDSTLVDLSNVGCTGSSKALNLARSLDGSFRQILVLAVECPSTLVDISAPALDLWQGNCTFGDGCGALWISADPDEGPGALAIEEIHYRQRADDGLDLIRWGYRDYYTFALADEKTFDRDVRNLVAAALSDTRPDWRAEPRWAIHPAGIILLRRLSRELGIPKEAVLASVEHFREFSNMSSASILHILKRHADEAAPGEAINLLTMGAGFNVLFGRLRKLR